MERSRYCTRTLYPLRSNAEAWTPPYACRFASPYHLDNRVVYSLVKELVQYEELPLRLPSSRPDPDLPWITGELFMYTYDSQTGVPRLLSLRRKIPEGITELLCHLAMLTMTSAGCPPGRRPGKRNCSYSLIHRLSHALQSFKPMEYFKSFIMASSQPSAPS